jgi:hypothetical protein
MADGGKVEEFSAGNLRRDREDHDLGKEMEYLLRSGIPRFNISNVNNY